MSLQRSIENNRKASAEYSKQLKDLDGKISSNRAQIKSLTDGMKVNELSMRQLKQRAAELKKQLDLTSKSGNPEMYRKLSKEYNECAKQIYTLGQKHKTLNDVFTIWKANIVTFLSGAVTQGILSIGRQMASTIISFEQANANLASVLGKSQKEVEALTRDAERLGASTQYTASQITLLQTELAKLGFTQHEILQSTEAVQAFATATGASLPDAAKLAGAALRAFGLDAGEMERVVSVMGVATTKSALDFNYLQNSLSTIAPVARTFGFTLEDTTALLGTLANSGFDASSAATATRNILLNLADTSGKLAKRLGEPIQKMDQLIPALRRLQAGGVDLAEALDLTDKRSVAAFNTFISGTDTLETLRDSITGVSDELHRMEHERLQTVQGSITLLRSAWDGLLLSFSNSKGAVKTAIDALTALVNKANKWMNPEAKKTPWLEQQERYRQSLEEMGKMGLEEARNYNEQLTKQEALSLESLQQQRDNAADRDNQQAVKYYDAQIAALKVYQDDRRLLLIQMEADDKERREREKEEERKRLAKQAYQSDDARRKQQEERRKQYQKRLEELKQYMQEDAALWAEQYSQGQIDEAEYRRLMLETERDYTEQMLRLARDMGQDTAQLSKQLNQNQVRTRQQADKQILDAAKRTRNELLKLYDRQQQDELAALERKKKRGLISTADYEQQKKDLAVTWAARRLQVEQTYSEAVKDLQQDVVADAAQAVEQAAGKLQQAFSIDIDAFQDGLQDAGKGLQALSDIAGAASDVVQSYFEAETAALEAEKQKQLTIAGDNADERERIEQEYAQKELDLKKRQADADAAVKSAELWVNTAIGIVNAWSSAMAFGPIAGPILAGVMSGLLLTNAGMQEAAILKQRDAIKNTTLSNASSASGTATASTTLRPQYAKSAGSTGSSGLSASAGSTIPQYASGGYTGDGPRLEPAGIVHRGEYVVAQPEMHNPAVVPMIRRIEQIRLQRNSSSVPGQQSSFHTPQSQGFADGGYTDSPTPPSSVHNPQLAQTLSALTAELRRLQQHPLRAEVNYRQLKDTERKMQRISK